MTNERVISEARKEIEAIAKYFCLDGPVTVQAVDDVNLSSPVGAGLLRYQARSRRRRESESDFKKLPVQVTKFLECARAGPRPGQGTWKDSELKGRPA